MNTAVSRRATGARTPTRTGQPANESPKIVNGMRKKTQMM